MRVLHTSDWHLGMQLHGVSLLEDQRRMVDCLLDTVRRERVDAVLLAGDLFDHAVARPEAIRLYNDAMTALCRDCGVQVLAVAGNHDGAERLAACGELLRSSGLYIAGRLCAPVEPVLAGDAAFFLLPWFNAEEVRALYPETQARGASEAMEAVVSRLRPVAGRRNILVGHCFVSGAQVSESDRAAMVGGGSRIATELFAGFDYVALGHLHRPQNPAGNIRYSGSPLQYSFSEAGQEKSFTLLDTETMERRCVPVEAGRGLRVLRGEFETLLMQLRFAGTEDYLKVELTDCQASMDRLELLRDCCPNLLLLTGTNPEGESAGLTVEELSALSPRDLVLHFYADVAGGAPDEEQMAWFEQAAQEAEREGSLQ